MNARADFVRATEVLRWEKERGYLKETEKGGVPRLEESGVRDTEDMMETDEIEWEPDHFDPFPLEEDPLLISCSETYTSDACEYYSCKSELKVYFCECGVPDGSCCGWDPHITYEDWERAYRLVSRMESAEITPYQEIDPLSIPTDVVGLNEEMDDLASVCSDPFEASTLLNRCAQVLGQHYDQIDAIQLRSIPSELLRLICRFRR